MADVGEVSGDGWGVAQSSPVRLMTFTRRRVSPKVRSMRLVCRIRLWCSVGNRRYEVSA